MYNQPMNKFSIAWQNSSFKEGSKVYTAKTAEEAEKKFNLDFGPDYMVVFVKKVK